MLEYIKADDPLVLVGSFSLKECTRLQGMLEKKGIVCHTFGAKYPEYDYYGTYDVKQLCVKKSALVKALPVIEKFRLSL